MAVSTQSRSPFDAARGHAALADINITPLIDVMLVLLIIFMVIAPVVSRSLDARLPQPGPPPDAAAPAVERVELSVHASGQFSLDGAVLSGEALADALAARIERVRAAGKQPVLLVGAGDDADYQAFAEALSVARASGIEEIGVAP